MIQPKILLEIFQVYLAEILLINQIHQYYLHFRIKKKMPHR